MPAFATPGVYHERVDSGAGAVTALRTDIAGFVGIAQRGPLHLPVVVESWRQFLAWFGSFTGAGYLAYAVRGFFENGGRRCWIVRVASELAGSAGLTLADTAGAPAWRIEASSPGVWGDALDVAVVATRRAQTRGTVAGAAARYARVDASAGFVRGTLLRITQGALAALRVVAHVDGERGRLYWVDPEAPYRLPYDEPLAGFDPGLPLVLSSLEYTLQVREQGHLAAVFEGLSPVPEHPRYGPRLLAVPAPAADSAPPVAPAPVVIRELRDAAALRALAPLDIADPAPRALRGGADGLAALTVRDFIGEVADPLAGDAARALARRGLAALDEVVEVALVALPDIHIQPQAEPVRAPPVPCVPDPCLPAPPLATTPRPVLPGDLPPVFGEAQVARVQAALVAHCERHRDRFALLDPPYAAVRDPRLALGAIRNWRRRFDSSYCALYGAWLQVADPLGAALLRAVPPSGHVAGQAARGDLASGVHRAPAGTALGWVQDVTLAVDDGAHGVLNDEHVNAIRAYPGRGIRVAGARTLSSDPDWRFINVRRLLMMVEKAIGVACQWAVFEPNDSVTRARLHMTLTSFLLGLWERGALAGDTESAAFFVRCGEDNNPASARGRGELLAEVGVAPATPFEFVVLRVGRTANAFEIAEAGRAHGAPS